METYLLLLLAVVAAYHVFMLGFGAMHCVFLMCGERQGGREIGRRTAGRDVAEESAERVAGNKSRYGAVRYGTVSSARR